MTSYYICNDCGHEWHNYSNVEDEYCDNCESADIEYTSDDNDNEGLSLHDD